MKNSIKVLTVIFSILLVFSNVFAGEMLDYTIDTDICKFSDYIDDTNNLPYVRISGGRTEIDTILKKSGLCVSGGNVDITKDMSKFQIITSGDTIRMNGKVENAILFAQTVIINGDIDGTVIVVANNVTITESANINGELLTSSYNLDVSGNIVGNVIGILNYVKVTDTANISGGLRVISNFLELSSEPIVTGKIYCKTSNLIDVPVSLKDNVELVKIEVESEKIPLLQIVFNGLVISGVVLLISSKTNLVKNIYNKVKNNAMRVPLFGAGFIVIIPVIILLVILLTIIQLYTIAVPITVIIIGIFALAAALKSVICSIVICEHMTTGKYAEVFNTNLKKYTLCAIVFISLNLIEYIPVIGSWLEIVITILSLGILINLIYSPKKKNNEA